MRMALVLVFLLTALVVGLNQIEANPNYSPETRDKLAELLRRMISLEDEKAVDIAAGADPDGLFQKCVCMTPTHTDCTCSGHIGTGVWASMHSSIDSQNEALVTLTCNEKTLIKKEENNPSRNGPEVCSPVTECGGANVKICFKIYDLEIPDSPGESSKGCTDVTVSFNGGTTKKYKQCVPGTPVN
ncbi:uncharacterized protein LOC119735783 [Patiria miniata]|uniref:Uncharacterized protein n=1 Tax=Patiria miniata TaxID=46514 RepID=A0A914AQC5_PATMI|nr:uncharacterized protein LOC119735783 [Patiria miniata]